MRPSHVGHALTQSGLHLAQAIASRMCHDLSGSLGSLTGTLELAGEDPINAIEAHRLASDSATSLSRRLCLLRAAWGQDAAPMQGTDLVTLARGLPQLRRIQLRFEGFDVKRGFSAALAQLILNSLMLAVESLEGEGAVLVARFGGHDVLITITGPRAGWPPSFAELLADPGAAEQAACTAEAHELLGPLTALFAHSHGVRGSLLLATNANTPPALLLQQY